MSLSNKGQRDPGVTRTPGPIGVQEAKPPADVIEDAVVQLGPAGVAVDTVAPTKDTDLREQKTHVQVAQTEPAPEKEQEPPASEKKVAKKKKVSWIEFHVVRKKSDDSEENLPGVDLHVVLPDKNEVKAKTGGNGKRKLEPIDPGTCDIKGMRYRRPLEFVSIKSS